jgi:aspartyl protease family protein
VSRRLLWTLLLGTGLSLAVLIASSHRATVADLLRYDFASLLVKIALLVFIGGLVLTLFREPLSRALEAVLFWVVVALLLVVGYTYRFELRDISDRVLAELIPGRAATRAHTVEIVKGRAGDFSVAAHINGARVSLVLDTGASAVVLTQEAAKTIGLPVGFLTYSVNVETANGRTQAAPVTLDRLAIGGITERSVQALIAQPGQLKVSLLGMSFLSRLESWEVRGDKLLLRGHP